MEENAVAGDGPSGSLSADWLWWMRDYVAAAERFTEEDPVAVSPEDEELVAIKLALYARALTLFQGALLLIDHDRQLDFRIHARGVIEAAIYLIALDGDPGFVEKMKEDDYKSRHARAALYLNADAFDVGSDVKAMLEEFVAQGSQGAKTLPIRTLLEGTEFDRLYRTYRDISGDAAHVSLTSLNRHYVEHPEDGSAMLLLYPGLDHLEMQITLKELGISMTLATLVLMKVKEKTALWDEFQVLLRRYRALVDEMSQHSSEAISDAD